MSDVMDGDSGMQLAEREFAPAQDTMSALAKSELDVQITTAKAFKRGIKKFLDDALSMATVTEEVAGGCLYALPRDGKTIEGPSVRLAEIVASAWGNIHAATRIVGDDGKFIIAQAVVWDLERNVRLGFEVRRRITGKTGKRFSDDMIGVTANAAMSIAYRNAIFKLVPSAFTQPIYQACRRVAVGDDQTLSARRTEMLAYFQKKGVKPDRLFAAIGVASEVDIDLEKLALLRGIATAIRDGDTTVDEAFPDPTGAEEAAAKKAGAEGGTTAPAPSGSKVAAEAERLRLARGAAPAGEQAPFEGGKAAPGAAGAPGASEAKPEPKADPKPSTAPANGGASKPLPPVAGPGEILL